MKYQINPDLIEVFEVDSVEIEAAIRSDSHMRVWITVGLLILFTVLVVGGLALSFKTGSAETFDALLSATSPFVAMAIGYYFGKQEKD